ncbi:MAG: His/Gly/Thr/Pro-type tRNA ligase C-terminal domain-containing protein, partial [Desulfobulbales bacterium]
GIGFAMGIERLFLLMQQQEEKNFSPPGQMDIFIAALGKEAARYSQVLVHRLRQHGLQAAMDYSGRSLKAQMKQAGRMGVRFTLIIGDEELEQKSAVLRNMVDKVQSDFPLQPDTAEECRQLVALFQHN